MYEIAVSGMRNPANQRQLFDYQVETSLAEGLSEYRPADMCAFSTFVPESGLFLFVPPPPRVLDLTKWMAKVSLNGRTGVNRLTTVEDVVDFPIRPVFLLGVDDQPSSMAVASHPGRQEMSPGRHFYNVWCGIIHAVFFPW